MAVEITTQDFNINIDKYRNVLFNFYMGEHVYFMNP